MSMSMPGILFGPVTAGFVDIFPGLYSHVYLKRNFRSSMSCSRREKEKLLR